jgi:hypothetical protein
MHTLVCSTYLLSPPLAPEREESQSPEIPEVKRIEPNQIERIIQR